MKKSILLTFVLAAAISATLLTGCGKDSATNNTSNCTSFAVKDTGAHKIYLGSLPAPLSPIHDSLVGSVDGNKVTISSSALGRNITGTINSTDCNKVDLDPIIFAADDSLKIATSLPGLGGFVIIKNIQATGSGTINSAGEVTTIINISKGSTNITSPINLTNLAGLGLNLKGSFIKFQ